MKIPQPYRRPVLFALLLHAVLLLVLIFNIGPSLFRAPPGSAPMKTVQATTVSEAAVQAAVHAAHQEQTEAQKQIQKKQMEARAQASAKAKAKKELMEARALATAKSLKQAQLKLASEQKQKAEKLKQVQAQKKLMEARAQASAKLAAQKKIQALQQKLMQQQLNSEAKDISSLTSQAQQQGAIDQYKAAILSAIQSNWRIDQINNKLKCIYSVNLAPDGTVLSIQLVKSSGSDSLDQSAKQAITLASPLPVPNNPVLFNHFRQLVLTLSPQGILQS